MGLRIHLAEIPALADGERGASQPELAELDVHGFVVVPAVLTATEVEVLRAEFERLVAADPASATHERGTRRTNADRTNAALAVCWRHRVVLDAAAHLLGATFEVGHVDLRDPVAPHGVQRHHPDHGPTPCEGLTATWFLDGFTAENGGTRVLPGSHRTHPSIEANVHTSVDGEVVATGPPGSVLLRDARLFHAAGRNLSGRTRRSALVFFQHSIPGAD